MSGLTDRLPRLLALLPYLQANPGVAVTDAAAELDVSPSQLRRDLELLWMCGLPGYGPGDLIDIAFEADTVSVTHDAGLTRPLRLSQAEAGSLAVSLRALGDLGGVVGRDVVERALSKVEAAAGGGAMGTGVAASGPEAAADPAVAATVAAALAARHPVRIRYFSAGRDETTDRVVEPWELVVVAGRSYLEAWCRRAAAVRLFRMDRIEDAVPLPETFTPPTGGDAARRDDPFDLGEDLPLATVVLDPGSTWVAEQYPVESTEPLPGGGVRVRLRYSDPEWLIRLVLSFGGVVRLEEPADLAAEVVGRARTALAAYPPREPGRA